MSGQTGAALVCIFFLQVLSPGSGFPNGAPASACEDMIPRHAGVQPQPTPAPYTLHASTLNNFQPGQPVTVVIKGPEYRGVLLEARAGENTNALGTWNSPPTDTKFLTCSGNSQGAITHSNTNIKGNLTEYNWVPPIGANNIYFVATVAQQRTVFWLNVRSATLSQASGGINLAAGVSPLIWDKEVLLPLLVPSLVLTRLCPF